MGIWTAIKMTIVLTLLTGIIYPIAIAGLAELIFPFQAHGSLLTHDNHVVGSALIGQNFSSAGYFHGRPSAAGDKGYDATSSSGSNSGPTNKAFIDTVRTRVKALREEEPGLHNAAIPVDMVTASGSGLDPEISPASASAQVERIAKARSLDEETVRALIQAHTRGRWAGILGEPGVNVLELNLALDDRRGNRSPISTTAKGAPN
jgi:K+-transporting ATPase ATPase C chain